MFKNILNFNSLKNNLIGFFVKLGVFGVVTILFLTSFQPFIYVDTNIYDRLYYEMYSEREYQDVAVIMITDKTFEYFEANKVPREAYAKILDNELKDAKAVAFDILFPNMSNKKSDDAFSRAVDKHGKTVLGYLEASKNNDIILPYDSLLQATKSLGYVNYEYDTDGFVRKYLLTKETGLGTAQSLVYSTLDVAGYDFEVNENNNTVEVYLTSTGKKISQFNTDENGAIYRLPLSSDKNHYSVYEFSEVYEGKYPPSVFEDTIVFFGGSYAGSADIIKTPIEEILGVKFIVDSLIGVLEGFNPIIISSFIMVIYTAFVYLLVELFTTLLPGKYKWVVPLSAILITFTFGAVSATLSMVIINIAYPSIIAILAFVINLLFSYLNKELQSDIHKLPINAILQLNNIKTSDNYTFASYIKILEEGILNDIHLTVEHIEINEKHELYKEYLEDIENNNEIITVQNYIFIPLSNKIAKGIQNDNEDTDEYNSDNDKTHYCVLKSKGKIDRESVLHVSALILSADIYFKFAKESKGKQRLFNSIIESMVAAIDAKDAITSGHSKRVAEVSVRIGKLLHLSDYELERLHFAAIIHDIGKIGISDDVLNKPSFFSNDDFKEIRKHPEKGIQIMQGINLDSFLSAGILYHHERMDGKGYPHGISGDEIPKVARIIKIADVYDALVSERQYKKPWPIEKVCNLFYEGRGTEFDAELVDIFLEDIKPEGWVKPEGSFEHKKVFRNDTKKIALRFLQVYDDNIRERLDEQPISLEFDFDLSKDFAGLAFGNHFTDKNWLYNNPICAKVYKEQEEMFYFKDDIVTKRRFTYIFLRGYLSSGIVSSNKTTEDKAEYMIDLYEKLGEPFHNEDNIQVWDNNKFYIINFKNEEENKAHNTIYINKYVL